MKKKKKYIIMMFVFILPVVYLACCNTTADPRIDNTIHFNKHLSFYGIYRGNPADLSPASNVEEFELSSTLFTDYAEKQRLIKLPKGKKMRLVGNGLPEFPEGTLIAKTFYYPLVPKGKQIIETRLLLLDGGRWNVATYKWNKEQTEAFVITEGTVVPVKKIDSDGRTTAIAYRIPGNKECVSCHHSKDVIVPIGPKANNLNINVVRNNSKTNQLQYFADKGLMNSIGLDKINKLPGYNDTLSSVDNRARGYLEINCAHCHRKGGFAAHTSLDLDFNTTIGQSGLRLHRNNILIRMSEMGDYHMPKLGTTVIDTAGLRLIKDYLKNLKK